MKRSKSLYIPLVIFVTFFMLTCFNPVFANDALSFDSEATPSDLPPFEIIFYDLNTPPTTASEWAQASFSAQMLGDIDSAIELIQNATVLDPDSATYLASYSVLLTRRGDYEDAYDAAQRSIAIDPEYAVAWSAFGDAASMTNRIDEALDAYKNALSLNPEAESAVIIQYNIGSLYLNQGKFEEALAYFAEVFERDDSRAEVWLNKGVAEYEMGDYANALVSFEEALKLDPSIPGGLENLNAVQKMLASPQSTPLGVLSIFFGLGSSLFLRRKIL